MSSSRPEGWGRWHENTVSAEHIKMTKAAEYVLEQVRKDPHLCSMSSYDGYNAARNMTQYYERRLELNPFDATLATEADAWAEIATSYLEINPPDELAG